ncbi:hypothetical protein DOLIC_00135 [Dolichomitus sp. PSUC_FEM 10030005]|nr:hypothetical protein [Dolichomitus sp. PSUC_FEM 10030005]
MDMFLRDHAKGFCSAITNRLKSQSQPSKVFAIVLVNFIKTEGDCITVKFATQPKPIYRTSNIDDWFYTNIRLSIVKNVCAFEYNTGGTLHSITRLTVNFIRMRPNEGVTFVNLPDAIIHKRACVNVHNKDNECFRWAILSALCFARQGCNKQISEYSKHSGALNFTGIQFPVSVTDVAIFQQQNDISINLFTMKKKRGKFEVLPHCLTKQLKSCHVNLLLVQDYYIDEEEESESLQQTPTIYHYVWIRNLSRLVSAQLSKTAHRLYICDGCLLFAPTNEDIEEHKSKSVRCRVLRNFE